MKHQDIISQLTLEEKAHLLQEILRDDWGFDGFVVSDWGANNDFTEGVRAGSNLEMPGTGGDGPRQLMLAVAEGRITEAQVDRRVDELLDVMLLTRKAVAPLKDKPFDQDAHHAFARKASEQSIVLLNNEDGYPAAPEGGQPGSRPRRVCPEGPLPGRRLLGGQLHQAGAHHGRNRGL